MKGRKNSITNNIDLTTRVPARQRTLMGQQVMKEAPLPAGPASGSEYATQPPKLENQSQFRRKRRPPTPMRKPTYEELQHDVQDSQDDFIREIRENDEEEDDKVHQEHQKDEEDTNTGSQTNHRQNNMQLLKLEPGMPKDELFVANRNRLSNKNLSISVPAKHGAPNPSFNN